MKDDAGKACRDRAELEERLCHQAGILDAIKDAIIVADRSCRITSWNKAAERIYGWKAEEALGKPAEEVLHSEMPEEQRSVIYKGLENGKPVVAELVQPTKDGCKLVIEGYMTPLRDARGNITGYVAVNRDITERKRAEEELRRAKDDMETRVKERTMELEQANRALHEEIAERLRAEEGVKAERQRLYDVLETLPGYLVLLTPDHHVPFANRFFRERYGESHGRRCYEYLFGRTEPCEMCEAYRVLKTMTPHEWEWTGPDGRKYQVFDFPFTDTDGSTLILEMGIDITDRRLAEIELERHREHLEEFGPRADPRTGSRQCPTSVGNQSSAWRPKSKLAYLASFPERNPNPVMEVDLNGGIRYLNPAVLDLFPDLPEQGLAHPWLADWAAVVHPFHEGQTNTAMRDVTIGERSYQQALHYFAQDRFVRIYGFDITERKLAEKKMADENCVIALANKILEVFVEEAGEDMYDEALDFLLEGMESKHGVFGYIDEKGDLICPTMTRMLDQCEMSEKCPRYPREGWKGLWSRALLEKKTVYSNEPSMVPPGHVPIRNNLASPIIFQGEVVGLFNIANKESGYTEDDREFIEAIVDKIAPVLYAWIQKEWWENERRQYDAGPTGEPGGFEPRPGRGAYRKLAAERPAERVALVGGNLSDLRHPGGNTVDI